MYGPTPKISWISSSAGPAAGVGDPHVHRHRALVADRHLLVALVVTGADGGTFGAPVASTSVRLDDFDYELPPERIAQVPIEPRDAARLLVDRGSAPPEHRTVADLPDLLRPGDVVVVNETKVIPARLRLRRATGGAAEVLLLEAARPRRRRGRRSCARRAGCATARSCSTADGAPCHGRRRARRPATRSTSSCTTPTR